MLNPNNKQIKKVFINSLEDMTKNNEIPEDIIMDLELVIVQLFQEAICGQ